jgi:hypothetical protein
MFCSHNFYTLKTTVKKRYQQKKRPDNQDAFFVIGYISIKALFTYLKHDWNSILNPHRFAVL